MTPVTIGVFLLGLAIIVAVSCFVAAPLFRARSLTPAGAEPGERERWERQKRQALAAIKEAELDHQMGKLTDEDLAAMRARFEAQALEAMAVLERRKRGEAA
jgi:hypothetical protein